MGMVTVWVSLAPGACTVAMALQCAGVAPFPSLCEPCCDARRSIPVAVTAWPRTNCALLSTYSSMLS